MDVTELGDVIDPQLVVVAARIEEIGTVDLVPEVLRRPDAGQHGRDDGNRDDRPAGAEAKMGPGDERPPDRPGMGRGRRGRHRGGGRGQSAIDGIVLAHAVVDLPWRRSRWPSIGSGGGR